MWCQGLYLMSTGCGFVYMLLAVWLAMHASVSSHTFGVKVLTRFVRLPIPTRQELTKASTQMKEFEKGGPFAWFRPVGVKANNWGKRDEHVLKNLPDLKKGEVGDHLKLYQHLQARWLSFDAYCRVCMSIGMNSTIQSCVYFLVGALLLEHPRSAPFTQLGSGIAVILVMQALALGMFRLDIRAADYHTRGHRIVEVSAVAVLNAAPSLIMAVALYHGRPLAHEVEPGSWPHVDPDERYAVAIVPYLIHCAWFCLVYHIISPELSDEGVLLPRRFRAVLFQSDVFAAEGDVSNDDNAPALEVDEDFQEELEQFLKTIKTYSFPPKTMLEELTIKTADPRLASCSIEMREEVYALCNDVAIRVDEAAVQRVLYKWRHGDVRPHLPPVVAAELERHCTNFQEVRKELYSCPHLSFASSGLEVSCQLLDLSEIVKEMETVRLSFDAATVSVRWVQGGVRKMQAFEDVYVMMQRFANHASQLMVTRRKQAMDLQASVGEDESVTRARLQLKGLQKQIQWLNHKTHREIEQDVLQRDGAGLTGQLAWRVTKIATIVTAASWLIAAFTIGVAEIVWLEFEQEQETPVESMTCQGVPATFELIQSPEARLEHWDVTVPSSSFEAVSMACDGGRVFVLGPMGFPFELVAEDDSVYFHPMDCAGLSDVFVACHSGTCGLGGIRQGEMVSCEVPDSPPQATWSARVVPGFDRGAVNGTAAAVWYASTREVVMAADHHAAFHLRVGRDWLNVIGMSLSDHTLAVFQPSEVSFVPLGGGAVMTSRLPVQASAGCFDGTQVYVATQGESGLLFYRGTP
mmetsp:Transcript_5699/g.13847  ORF Transcript_5699/g.13847 Transcript_5699/m.13847 type:complete len:805 (+) Transcript_5699:271-2685(+)